MFFDPEKMSFSTWLVLTVIFGSAYGGSDWDVEQVSSRYVDPRDLGTNMAAGGRRGQLNRGDEGILDRRSYHSPVSSSRQELYEEREYVDGNPAYQLHHQRRFEDGRLVHEDRDEHGSRQYHREVDQNPGSRSRSYSRSSSQSSYSTSGHSGGMGGTGTRSHTDVSRNQGSRDSIDTDVARLTETLNQVRRRYGIPSIERSSHRSESVSQTHTIDGEPVYQRREQRQFEDGRLIQNVVNETGSATYRFPYETSARSRYSGHTSSQQSSHVSPSGPESRANAGRNRVESSRTLSSGYQQRHHETSSRNRPLSNYAHHQFHSSRSQQRNQNARNQPQVATSTLHTRPSYDRSVSQQQRENQRRLVYRPSYTPTERAQRVTQSPLSSNSQTRGRLSIQELQRSLDRSFGRGENYAYPYHVNSATGRQEISRHDYSRRYGSRRQVSTTETPDRLYATSHINTTYTVPYSGYSSSYRPHSYRNYSAWAQWSRNESEDGPQSNALPYSSHYFTDSSSQTQHGVGFTSSNIPTRTYNDRNVIGQSGIMMQTSESRNMPGNRPLTQQTEQVDQSRHESFSQSVSSHNTFSQEHDSLPNRHVMPVTNQGQPLSTGSSQYREESRISDSHRQNTVASIEDMYHPLPAGSENFGSLENRRLQSSGTMRISSIGEQSDPSTNRGDRRSYASSSRINEESTHSRMDTNDNNSASVISSSIHVGRNTNGTTYMQAGGVSRQPGTVSMQAGTMSAQTSTTGSSSDQSSTSGVSFGRRPPILQNYRTETRTTRHYLNGKIVSETKYYQYFENGKLIHENQTVTSRDQMQTEGIDVSQLDLTVHDLEHYGILAGESLPAFHSQRFEFNQKREFVDGNPIYELSEERYYQDGTLVNQNQSERGRSELAAMTATRNGEIVGQLSGGRQYQVNFGQNELTTNTHETLREGGITAGTQESTSQNNLSGNLHTGVGETVLVSVSPEIRTNRYETREEQQYVNGAQVYDLRHERQFQDGQLLHEEMSERGPNELPDQYNHDILQDIVAGRTLGTVSTTGYIPSSYRTISHNSQNSGQNQISSTEIRSQEHRGNTREIASTTELGSSHNRQGSETNSVTQYHGQSTSLQNQHQGTGQIGTDLLTSGCISCIIGGNDLTSINSNTDQNYASSSNRGSSGMGISSSSHAGTYIHGSQSSEQSSGTRSFLHGAATSGTGQLMGINEGQSISADEHSITSSTGGLHGGQGVYETSYRHDSDREEHYEDGQLVRGEEESREWRDGHMTSHNRRTYGDGNRQTAEMRGAQLSYSGQPSSSASSYSSSYHSSSSSSGGSTSPGNYGEGECQVNPCANGGTCIPSYRGHVCVCQFGYKGLSCEEAYCPSRYCRYGGICEVDTWGRHRCSCPNGFTGERCETRDGARARRRALRSVGSS